MFSSVFTLVVWASWKVTDSVKPGEIFLYDIVDDTQTHLSEPVDPNGTLDDNSPRINDERVMWVQDDGQDTKVILYDLDTGNTTEYPQGLVWEDTSQTDGDLTVFTRHDGNDREVFLYDSRLGTYEQITDNDIEDRSPSVSGNSITWVGGEGQSSEIFLNGDIEPVNTDFYLDEPDSPSPSKTSKSDSGPEARCFIGTAACRSPVIDLVCILIVSLISTAFVAFLRTAKKQTF